MKKSPKYPSITHLFVTILGTFLFLSGAHSAFATSIRQIQAADYEEQNSGGHMVISFVAPVSENVNALYFRAVGIAINAITNDIYLSGVGGASPHHPSNEPQFIRANTVYAFNFQGDPLQISQGTRYEIHLRFACSSDPCVHIFGSTASSTVLVGNTGATTSAQCIQGCEGFSVPQPLDLPFFALETGTVVLNLDEFSPSATSTQTSLNSAQAFCGSATFATSTSFWDGVAASFSRGICLAFAYVFVPSTESVAQFGSLGDTARTKIPFSYAYELAGDVAALTASTTENLPTFSLPFPALGSTTAMGSLIPSSISFFSTTTISAYLSDSNREALLGLQRLAIWFAVVLMFYRRITPHHVVAHAH